MRLHTQLGKTFLENSGLQHWKLLTADGALEASPAVRISRFDFYLFCLWYIIYPWFHVYFFLIFDTCIVYWDGIA